MLDLDIKEIEKKLREIGREEDTYRDAELILNYHPNLYNAIKDWLNGNDKADYEFMGISIQMLAERYFGGGFFPACDEMDFYLKHPEYLARHKDNLIEYLDDLLAIE